jgi:IclR family acetate operon transcriptional repressor
MVDDAPDGPRTNVVIRALSVLECLADFRSGLTLQQLHERLGVPVGSMHRLLGTLHGEEFVSRLPRTKKYVLGPKALKLGGQGASYDTYLVAAQRATGETVSLSQLIDNRVVCVALAESSHALRLFVRLGQELPVHAAASARVVLAFQSEAATTLLIDTNPMQRFTEQTVQDVPTLLAHLAEVRRCGYDICSNELDEGVWAVAAPVHDATGNVNSSVTISGAMVRMTPQRRAEATRAALDAAQSMSIAQGYAGDELPRELVASPMNQILPAS